jgi:hypothetical protein
MERGQQTAVTQWRSDFTGGIFLGATNTFTELLPMGQYRQPWSKHEVQRGSPESNSVTSENK